MSVFKASRNTHRVIMLSMGPMSQLTGQVNFKFLKFGHGFSQMATADPLVYKLWKSCRIWATSKKPDCVLLTQEGASGDIFNIYNDTKAVL